MAKSDKNKLNITPLADRVLIKALDSNDKEKKSASGIIIPISTQDDKVDRGKVVAVGEGRVDSDGSLVPLKVKINDKVVFQWADKITVDEEEYYIVNETSILAVIK